MVQKISQLHKPQAAIQHRKITVRFNDLEESPFRGLKVFRMELSYLEQSKSGKKIRRGKGGNRALTITTIRRMEESKLVLK